MRPAQRSVLWEFREGNSFNRGDQRRLFGGGGPEAWVVEIPQVVMSSRLGAFCEAEEMTGIKTQKIKGHSSHEVLLAACCLVDSRLSPPVCARSTSSQPWWPWTYHEERWKRGPGCYKGVKQGVCLESVSRAPLTGGAEASPGICRLSQSYWWRSGRVTSGRKDPLARALLWEAPWGKHLEFGGDGGTGGSVFSPFCMFVSCFVCEFLCGRLWLVIEGISLVWIFWRLR